MTDPHDMLPIIRQMHEADGEVARARILLHAPYGLVLEYREAFEASCRRTQFALGEHFIAALTASLAATRDDHGNLPKDKALELRDARQALVMRSAGMRP